MVSRFRSLPCSWCFCSSPGAWNGGGDNFEAGGLPSAQTAFASIALPIVFDNSITAIAFGLGNISVNDSIDYGTPLADQRSYTITVRTAHPIQLLGLDIETNPLTLWSIPGQVPGGLDALAADGGLALDRHFTATWCLNDTSNWTIPRGGRIDLLPWSPTLDHSVLAVVTGDTSTPVVPMQVDLLARQYDRGARGRGRVQSGAAPSGSAISRERHRITTKLVRASRRRRSSDSGPSMGTRAPTGARPTGSPSSISRRSTGTFNLTAAVGAQVLYSLSAGTWGDGNLLPVGMPTDNRYLIVKGATSGYLADPVAYRAYVQVIVNHIHSMNQSVEYWTVGNELPMINQSVVDAFIGLFNIAETVIHATYPNALVGSDVMMMDPDLSPRLRQQCDPRGFLSFHFYPSTGLCVINGTFCPPSGPGLGTVDARLWQPVADISHVGFAAHLAQVLT